MVNVFLGVDLDQMVGRSGGFFGGEIGSPGFVSQNKLVNFDDDIGRKR